jgi:hypothetical protein
MFLGEIVRALRAGRQRRFPYGRFVTDRTRPRLIRADCEGALGVRPMGLTPAFGRRTGNAGVRPRGA